MPTPVRRCPVRRPPSARFRDLAPAAVALMVTEEASLWLGVTLPAAWTGWLVEHARGCIEHNPRWRKMFRRCSERGRDTLHVFMRHWLAARFHTERPDLFARLPIPEHLPTAESIKALESKAPKALKSRKA